MSNWNALLGETIAALGTEAFAPALGGAAGALFSYDICMIFAYDGTATPQSLYHNLPPETAQIVIWDYCIGPYLLDPFYAETETGRRSGMVGLRQMAPDKFFQSEYYIKHYSRTSIRDEVGVFTGLDARRTAVISFARKRNQPVFSARERTRLAEVAPVIEALLQAHWGGDAGRGATLAMVPSVPPLQVLLDRIAQGVLTPRETEVIAMVLRGYSSAAIGARLAISDETVKVHRKNAYRKLDISSQAQLFSIFIQALDLDNTAGEP